MKFQFLNFLSMGYWSYGKLDVSIVLQLRFSLHVISPLNK